MLFITIPVILYQLLFVFLLSIGGLLFGRKVLFVLAALCLIWTGTHLFFVPLAVFQTMVIVGTTVGINKLIAFRVKKKARPWVGQASYKRVGPVIFSQTDQRSECGSYGSETAPSSPNPPAPEEPPRTGQ